MIPLFGEGHGPPSETPDELPRAETLPAAPRPRRRSPEGVGQLSLIATQCERCGADFRQHRLGRPGRLCELCRGGK